MSKLVATRHAKQRMQQRGISNIQMQLIQLFGEDHLQKGGSYYSYVPEEMIRKLQAALGGLNSIAIVKSSDEAVITVMHKTQKMRATSYVA